MQSAEFRNVVGHALCACLVVCAAWPAGGARANDVRIFFGQPEYYTGTDITAFVPEAHWGESAPPGTYTLGVWAEIQCDISGPEPVMDVWNGMTVDFTSTGAPVTVSEVDLDNFDHLIGFGTAYRWEPIVDDPPDVPIFLISIMQYGLGGLYPREFGYGNGRTDWWSYTTGTPAEAGARYRYWLGNMTLSSAGPAQVWFHTFEGGITRVGGDPATDQVYFGETDPIPWDPASPDPSGYMPDFVFTPEPAGLLLMAMAGWLVRQMRSSKC